MRKPAPTKRGQVDSPLVMETLANKHQAGSMVSIVNALTTVYPTEVNNDSNTTIVCILNGCVSLRFRCVIQIIQISRIAIKWLNKWKRR